MEAQQAACVVREKVQTVSVMVQKQANRQDGEDIDLAVEAVLASSNYLAEVEPFCVRSLRRSMITWTKGGS